MQLNFSLATLLLLASSSQVANASYYRIVAYRGADCRGAVMSSTEVGNTGSGSCGGNINSESSSVTVQYFHDGRGLYLSIYGDRCVTGEPLANFNFNLNNTPCVNFRNRGPKFASVWF
ncbi:hypothetical protein B0T14DRAFT_556152 [Immersiella caudata]|uniref:Uncharacterized protein n=1 Tax=Immersiella caudata TaxID=314043 RepID=A0AA40BX28_9PEZI|nr:hypothetical protein B0T14DRAFT_556152 [Immersiella caudata]